MDCSIPLTLGLMGRDGGLNTLVSWLRICLSAEGTKNVFWPWLSPLRGLGSLTMALTGKFVCIYIYIYIYTQTQVIIIIALSIMNVIYFILSHLISYCWYYYDFCLLVVCDVYVSLFTHYRLYHHCHHHNHFIFFNTTSHWGRIQQLNSSGMVYPYPLITLGKP